MVTYTVSRCFVCSNGTLVQKPELGGSTTAQPVHLMSGHRTHAYTCSRMSKIKFVRDIGVTVPRGELKGSFKERQVI